MIGHLRGRPKSRGQALVEFALIMPLFVLVLVGVIVLGVIVFYNQQLNNAAREAARFASIHSASDQFCPVVGALNPTSPPITYSRCDQKPWPRMTAFGQSKVFGLNSAGVVFSTCWSGYQLNGTIDAPPPGNYDLPLGQINSVWQQCTIGGADPTTSANAIPCAAALATVDKASSASENPSVAVANRVTVYACYKWAPPMAGFLLIPQTVTLRAVISEPIQRQQ